MTTIIGLLIALTILRLNGKDLTSDTCFGYGVFALIELVSIDLVIFAEIFK